ncbi:MAG: DUF1850 domain-containing protein [Thermodesulfobacteriota bacterium]
MFREGWGYLLLICLASAIFFYPLTILEVKDVKADRAIIRRKVSSGDTFEFRYIHSVEKVPVSGFFMITPRRMIQPTETQFPSYGAGLPSAGDEVKLQKDRLIAIPKSQEMEKLSFFVSPFTEPSLFFKNDRFDLSLLKEGKVVSIEVKRYPIGGMLIPYGRSDP